MKRLALASMIFASAALTAVTAQATDEAYVLTLDNHQFTPATLVIPAGQTVKLTVQNRQSTPAEFESESLGREKVVAANSQITVNLGPLSKGSYSYVDDFHRDSTGTIKVK